jgi:WbqC-like protein family
MSKSVSIHQPNYMPWLGFFNKIAKSDVFVILDNVQVPKQSPATRNYIKSKEGSKVLLSVSLKNLGRDLRNYNEAEIDYRTKWNIKHLNKIKDAYGRTEYFRFFFPVLEQWLTKLHDTLGSMNIDFILMMLRCLEINTDVVIASSIGADLGRKNERNVNIVKYINGGTYISGTGAAKYNDEALFKQNGIKLVYNNYIHPFYEQPYGEFLPNLSIIDSLFNVGIEHTKRLVGVDEA